MIKVWEGGGQHFKPGPDMMKEGPQTFLDKEDDRDRQEKLCNFISKYVSKLYGVNAIRTWLKTNKGKSFLHMISMCDIAYCICLVKNSERVWTQDKEVRQMDKSEQQRYKTWKTIKNAEEKERYRLFTPRFSGGSGMKRTFCGVMWNEEGIAYYEETLTSWRTAYRDKMEWLRLEQVWEDYVVRNRTCQNTCAHWKRRGEDDVGELDDENTLVESTTMAILDEPVLLRGDLGFVGDRNQEWRTTENTESTYSKNSDQQRLEQENGTEEAMLNDDLNSALMGEDDSKVGDDATSTDTNNDQGSMNVDEMDTSNKLESTNGEGEDNADTGGNNMEHKWMPRYDGKVLFGNLGGDTSSDESDMEVDSSKKNDNESKLAHESDSDGVDRMKDGGSLTEEESKNLKYLLEKANRPVGEVEDHSGKN